MGAGAVLVGIDSYNIDSVDTGERPVHTILLKHEIPIVEHLTGLAALPETGSRLLPSPSRSKASAPSRCGPLDSCSTVSAPSSDTPPAPRTSLVAGRAGIAHIVVSPFQSLRRHGQSPPGRAARTSVNAVRSSAGDRRAGPSRPIFCGRHRAVWASSLSREPYFGWSGPWPITSRSGR